MSNETTEKLIFVLAGAFAGWLLSTMTSALKDAEAKRRERRRLFSRLWMILEKIVIQLTFAPIAREAGLLDSFAELVDIDESWRRRIPPAPPCLPKSFDDIAERVAEWESERGEDWITRQLEGLRGNITTLHKLHACLSVQAQEGEQFISERGLIVYNGIWYRLEEDAEVALRRVSRLRLSYSKRMGTILKRAYEAMIPPNIKMQMTGAKVDVNAEANARF
jgi:hypothetical protein